MTIHVLAGMLDYMREAADACRIQIQDADDVAAARRALELVSRDLWDLPNPDEPSEAAPSFVSDVEMLPGGPMIWFDMDAVELMPTVLEAVMRRLQECGVGTATIGWPDDETHDESRHEGVPEHVLGRYDERGLSLGFPDDIPFPTHGYLQSAGGSTDRFHGTWNSDEPVDDYVGRLRSGLAAAGYRIVREADLTGPQLKQPDDEQRRIVMMFEGKGWFGGISVVQFTDEFLAEARRQQVVHDPRRAQIRIEVSRQPL